MLNSRKYAAIAIVGAGLAVGANAPASAYGGYGGHGGYGGYYGSASYGCRCPGHRRISHRGVNFWHTAYRGLVLRFTSAGMDPGNPGQNYREARRVLGAYTAFAYRGGMGHYGRAYGRY
jgi:hypothetical protein